MNNYFSQLIKHTGLNVKTGADNISYTQPAKEYSSNLVLNEEQMINEQVSEIENKNNYKDQDIERENNKIFDNQESPKPNNNIYNNPEEKAEKILNNSYSKSEKVLNASLNDEENSPSKQKTLEDKKNSWLRSKNCNSKI